MYRISESITRKFIDIVPLENLEIETDTGWKKVKYINKTVTYDKWHIVTDSGYEMYCADTHILFDENYNEIFAMDLIPGKSKIITKEGPDIIYKCYNTDITENMFDVTVDSDDHRFWSNGILSHNSVLLDALCFSLFGKPYRGIKKSSLVNSINKKDCQVEISFEVGGVSFKVLRGISPNVFEIYRNGEIINQTATTKDYQEILERGILKFNYKSFTQIVILGATSYTPFMELSAGDRRAFVEDLLDIQVFSTMGEIVKEMISHNKEGILKGKGEISLLQQKYDIEKRHQDSRVSEGKERLRALKEEYNKSLEKYNTLRESAKSIKETLNNLSQDIPDKRGDQDNLTKLLRYETTLENKIDTLERDIKFLEGNDDCPTCKQTIQESFKAEEIDKKRGEIKSHQETLKDLGGKIKNSREIIQGIDQQLLEVNEWKVKLSSLSGQGKTLEGQLKALVEKIKVLSNPPDTSQELNLGAILGQIEAKEGELESLLVDKTYYDISQGFLKDGGIKSQIIKQYLPIINQEINDYLTKFEFYVNFSLDETFKETIQARYREDHTYSNFSEGEKARINLAILLAWRGIARKRNSANTNLLVLDEVFDSSMDYSGIENLLEILHGMEDVNIFVISHKGDVLTDKFNRQINVTKSKNFSRMKVINGNSN